MAVSNVLPASGSPLAFAETFSFEVTDGYTSLQVRVTTAGGVLEAAYDDGVAAGYSVVVEDLGATVRFTVGRDSGWSIDPTTIYVTEDGDNTEWTYDIYPTEAYPEGMQPYNDLGGVATSVVTSFEGRDGNVVSAAGDYDSDEVDNTSTVTGASVSDALEQLDADITAIPAAPVDSVHGRTGAVVAVLDDYDDTLITHATTLGTPTTTTVSGVLQDTGSPSVVNGSGLITDNGDGTVQVSGGYGYIRATDSESSTLSAFDFAAVNPQALTDGEINFIYAEYNAGTPQIAVTITKRTDFNTNILLGTVHRNTTFLHITNHVIPSGNVSNKLTKRFNDTEGLKRASGSILSETGTRNLAVTAGVWWHGLDESDTAAKDTSGSDTFLNFYRDGVGGWTTVSGVSQIDNLQWDDGDGGLATLSANRYGVHWVYVGVDDHLYVIYGRGDYTASQWGDAPAPSDIPPHMQEQHAGLIGRVVVQKSAASFTSVDSAFDITFTVSGAADHGDLSGLADDDHTQYHTDARGDARYSLLAHTHLEVDVTDLDKYTVAEVDALLAGLTTDHGDLDGLTDDDHVRYVDIDGTRVQDAVFLTERPDHVNTPAAGKLELWAELDTFTTLKATDDFGIDWSIGKSTALVDATVPFWNSTVSGDWLSIDAGFTYDGAELRVPESIALEEQASAPSSTAGVGRVWVQDTAPTQWMSTSDTGVSAALVHPTGIGRYGYDSSTTDADPGSGDFRMNHATWTSATEMYMSYNNDEGLSLSYHLDSIEAYSNIILTKVNDPRIQLRLIVTAVKDKSVSEGPAYVRFTVVYPGGSDAYAQPSNNDEFYINIYPPGSDRVALTLEETTTLTADTARSNSAGHLYNADIYGEQTGQVNDGYSGDPTWRDADGLETNLGWGDRNRNKILGGFSGELFNGTDVNGNFGGTTPTSSDGNISWIWDDLSNHWYYSMWDASLFDAKLCDSVDGINWTTHTTFDFSTTSGDMSWPCTNGALVAIACDGRVYLSTDLTAANLVYKATVPSVTESTMMFYHTEADLWVHVGYSATDNYIHTSPDCVTWTQRWTRTIATYGVHAAGDTTRPTLDGRQVPGQERIFCYSSSAAYGVYSDNATTWSNVGTGGYPTQGMQVCHYCPGLNGGSTWTGTGGGWIGVDADGDFWYTEQAGGGGWSEATFNAAVIWKTTETQGWINIAATTSTSTCYGIPNVSDSSADCLQYLPIGNQRGGSTFKFLSSSTLHRAVYRWGNGCSIWTRHLDSEDQLSRWGPIKL